LSAYQPTVVTDFEAVAAGYVSITPIQMDATNHDILSRLSQYFDASV
jgi:5'-nucleotidase